VNEYQHAAQTILDADEQVPSIRTPANYAIREHRAALERIATGQAVVVEREHAERARRALLYLYDRADDSTEVGPAFDAFSAALAAQEGNADA
jgi:hypothetical protein